MSERNESSDTIFDWSEQTFGPVLAGPKAARANIEMAELLAEVNDPRADPSKIAEEAADVVIILTALVHHLGFNIFEEVDRKMAINRKRIWVSKGDGTGHHI